MKKIIITIVAIIMAMSLVSCTERSTSKSVTFGDTKVRVTEKVMKDDEIIEEKNYTIIYETPEDAWMAVHGGK